MEAGTILFFLLVWSLEERSVEEWRLEVRVQQPSVMDVGGCGDVEAAITLTVGLQSVVAAAMAASCSGGQTWSARAAPQKSGSRAGLCVSRFVGGYWFHLLSCIEVQPSTFFAELSAGFVVVQ